MIRTIQVVTAILFFQVYFCIGQEVISIDNKRELFIDDFLLEEKDNIDFKLHQPKRKGKVLYFDKPWEGAFSLYTTIIKDGNIYRAYYRGVPIAGEDGNSREVTCVAESMDGVHWVKPKLGIYEINGTLENNVILANAAPVTHNFSPFIDKNPDCDTDEKYKAIGGTLESGLIGFVSKDGLKWKKISEKPIFTEGIFDSQNVVFWSESEKKYIVYFRTWTGEGYTGIRTVSRSTSEDFIHWSAPEKMTFGETPYEHLYTQQTSPYYRAPHIYVAIGARFMPNRQVVSDQQAAQLNVNPKYYKDCSDAIFMTSRGGNEYDRTFMESFIRPGIGLENWVSRTNYPALNVVQTSDTEMSIYVNEDYAQPTAHLSRYSIRIDGFASLNADYTGGIFVTKPFIFEGKELELNYSTSAAGSIKIEIQDINGEPIPDYTLSECQEIIGNEIKRTVSWNGKTDVSKLASREIRLKFFLKDADLFSFKFN